MEKSFTVNEYQKITIPLARMSMYLDGYESFGWQWDEHYPLPDTGESGVLHLKRSRKILNKMELTRLQRNFEASMEELDTLEHSKATMPMIVSLSTGVVGTGFMAGAVFAVTANPPIIWLCVLLVIPGFIGWLLPYFMYKKLLAKRTEVVTPLIEQKYNEIYELCDKGTKLL